MKTATPAKATSKATKAKTTKPATAKAPLAEPKKPKAKAKTTAKKAKAPEPAKVKVPTHTRPYLTGVVLKKHGLNSGVTPEMVKDLNKLYGVPNDRESAAQLKWAIHVLRGYVAAGKSTTKK